MCVRNNMCRAPRAPKTVPANAQCPFETSSHKVKCLNSSPFFLVYINILCVLEMGNPVQTFNLTKISKSYNVQAMAKEVVYMKESWLLLLLTG